MIFNLLVDSRISLCFFELCCPQCSLVEETIIAVESFPSGKIEANFLRLDGKALRYCIFNCRTTSNCQKNRSRSEEEKAVSHFCFCVCSSAEGFYWTVKKNKKKTFSRKKGMGEALKQQECHTPDFFFSVIIKTACW